MGDAASMTIPVVIGEVIVRQRRRAPGEVDGLVLVLARSDGSQALTEDVSRVHGTDFVEAQSPRGRKHAGNSRKRWCLASSVPSLPSGLVSVEEGVCGTEGKACR